MRCSRVLVLWVGRRVVEVIVGMAVVPWRERDVRHAVGARIRQLHACMQVGREKPTPIRVKQWSRERANGRVATKSVALSVERKMVAMVT